MSCGLHMDISVRKAKIGKGASQSNRDHRDLMAECSVTSWPRDQTEGTRDYTDITKMVNGTCTSGLDGRTL